MNDEQLAAIQARYAATVHAQPATRQISPAAVAIGTLMMNGYRELQSPYPTGYLGRVMVQAIERRQPLTDALLLDAARTELTIRHGAEITRLQIAGGDTNIIAVLFDGRTIHVPHGDPVDVLIPWREPDRYSVNTQQLARFHIAIGQMLAQVEKWLQRDHLARIVEELQAVARHSTFARKSSQLVFEQVIAANIELCVRASPNVRPARYHWGEP